MYWLSTCELAGTCNYTLCHRYLEFGIFSPYINFYLNLCVLQDAQDVYMEQERDRALTKKITMLQKVIRGWHYRKRFRKMKQSVITLQKNWKAYLDRKRYEQVSFQVLSCSMLVFVIAF